MFRSACAVVLGLVVDPVSAAGPSGVFSSIFDQRGNAASSTASATVSDGGNSVYNLDQLSEPASDFVGGTIDAFLGHTQVSGEERRCLSSGASNLASSLTESFGQAMDTYKAFKQQGTTAAQSPPAFPSQQLPILGTGIPAFAPLASTTPSLLAATAIPLPTALPTLPAVSAVSPIPVTRAAFSPVASEGEEAVVGMELAASLSNLYRMQKHLAKSCFKGDVLNEFEKASENLGNMSFVGGRLVANGADILQELSGALNSYEHQNFRAFGKDLGAAWRKVTLSQGSSSDVAEPREHDIEDATQGLVYGFFGNGFKLQVMSDGGQGDPAAVGSAFLGQGTQAVGQNMATLPASTTFAPGVAPASTTHIATIPANIPSIVLPTAVPPTSYPPSTLNVDLQTCIRGNMPLLRSAWAPVFELAETATRSTAEAPAVSDFMMSMMDLQLALKRCNVGPAQEAMLINAWEEGGGNLKTKWSVSNENVQTSSVTQLLSSAMEDYRDQQYYAFGKQLGKALQDTVVVTFPMKYEVDESGRLHNKIFSDSENGNSSTQRNQGIVLRSFDIASMGFLVVASLLVMRSRQSISRRLRLSTSAAFVNAPQSDLEVFVE